MLTAKSLRKLTQQFKDPDSYGAILTAMTSNAKSGFGNISLRYKPTKKNKELVDYAVEDLTKRGFRVYSDTGTLLSLEIEW